MAAMIAVPRPSFPGRCRAFTRGSLAASSSTTRPVPSGELSSTTSTSACGANWWISAINREMLSRSSYVATETSSRAGVPSCIRGDSGPMLNPIQSRGQTMATTFVIACPECSKQVRVSDEHVGKKIRCKGCEHVYAVRAPGGPPPAAKKAAAGAAKTKAAPPPPPEPVEGDEDYKYVLAQTDD